MKDGVTARYMDVEIRPQGLMFSISTQEENGSWSMARFLLPYSGGSLDVLEQMCKFMDICNVTEYTVCKHRFFE